MFFPLKSCLASDSERVSSKALDVKCDGYVQLTSEGDLAEPRQCLHRDHCVLCKIQIGTTVIRIKRTLNNHMPLYMYSLQPQIKEQSSMQAKLHALTGQPFWTLAW